MASSVKLLFAVVFLICTPAVLCQDAVGRVFIGEDENDTTTFFSFNENFVGVGFIPVYVGVFNATTGEQLPIDIVERIRLTCELIDGAQPGFTDALFETRAINLPSTINGEIQFQNVLPGRAASIQCWGESISPTGLFTKETSMSTPVLFEIRPPGTANILSSVVIVSNSDSTTQKQEFIVQLSETVVDQNVTVSCPQDPSDSMVLDIPDKIVLTGRDRAIMEVSVINQGDGRSVVNCSATSLNNGPQFEDGMGQGALFLLDEAEVALVPVVTDLLYPQMTAYLVLDATPESEVTYFCNITEVDSLDEARAIAESTDCAVPDEVTQPSRDAMINATVAPIDPTNRTSGSWILSSATITFTTDDRFKSVNIYRTNRYQPIQPEIVVVRCCAPPELNIDRKYNKTNSALLAIAYVTEERPINWTTAVDDLDEPAESEVIDTAFVELGPCPCDLTENKCNVDCCCDEDCTEDDLALFTWCIPGFYGGQEGEDERYKCSSQYFNKPDWTPFMCVEFENSGYLGLYRQPINATRDDESYRALVNEFPTYSFEEDSNRFDDSSPEARDPYVEGFAIKTGIRSQISESSVDTSNYFRLTLPQRTWNGKCVTPAPVRYLVDSENDCTQELKENMCSEFTRLSARMYAQSGGLWENQASPQVLQENAQATITYTNTNYYCLTDDEVLDYLGKTITRKEVFAKDQAYYFNENPDNFTDCNFNAQTGAYICGDLTFEPDDNETVSYTRCPWDDGFTQAPAPDLDTSANISVCNNSVVDVLYSFTWKGSEIEQLEATVFLGNLPLEVEKTELIVIDHVVGGQTETLTYNVTNIYPTQLTQKFQVEWTHNLNESIYENDEERSTEVYKRSGQPGYDFNLPIFSGVDARNETTDEFLYIDTNASKSLSLWNPSVSGFCEGASRSPINFGIDSQTSCMLRLGLPNLLDCENLRKSILYQQDNLMLSNCISRGGDPNRTDLEAWISVFREDISGIITVPNYPDEGTTVETTSLFPEVTTDYSSDNESLSYVDQLVGRCASVPASIHVDIMYALVGKINYVPVYEIIGAKISYGLSTWSLYCSGKDGEACTEKNLEETQAQVQTFIVSSSVSFILVPASPPETLTEYEQRQMVNKSDRDICEQEKCWRELFYPLTPAYTGETNFYIYGFTTSTVLFIIGYFYVTKPFY